MASKKKLSIEESSLEELIEAADEIIKDVEKCCSCEECRSSYKFFSGELASDSCKERKMFFIGIKEATKKFTDGYLQPKQNGKCSECKLLDKSYLNCSGYHFCTHWHNFTNDNGFCHAFESEGNSSESVDN